MSSLQAFFHTDWQAMTRADVTGLIMAVVLTLLMVALYIWVFKPSNRDNFEQYRDFVNEDEKREVDHGQTK
ncbi:MAG: CcoQ/FixQ family Cbb3-type cytochrome c oxidase assembly chaperone [Mariprofundus sp.]|nr:CcoQ/FixQ family Cbb3-type cytochrome c oxidase assembly chaperone [Mariprofundus sp.]